MLITSINNGIRKMLEGVLTLFMAVMVAAVVWQVFTRFVLQDPSSFTDELSRYMLIWIGILGGAYTYVIKRHLALDMLVHKLQARGRRILSIIINAIIMVFSAVTLGYGGWILMSNTLKNGQISPGIFIGDHHLLIGYVYVVVPLAGALICYFGLIDILTALLHTSDDEHTEEGR